MEENNTPIKAELPTMGAIKNIEEESVRLVIALFTSELSSLQTNSVKAVGITGIEAEEGRKLINLAINLIRKEITSLESKLPQNKW